MKEYLHVIANTAFLASIQEYLSSRNKPLARCGLHLTYGPWSKWINTSHSLDMASEKENLPWEDDDVRNIPIHRITAVLA